MLLKLSVVDENPPAPWHLYSHSRACPDDTVSRAMTFPANAAEERQASPLYPEESRSLVMRNGLHPCTVTEPA